VCVVGWAARLAVGQIVYAVTVSSAATREKALSVFYLVFARELHRRWSFEDYGILVSAATTSGTRITECARA